MRRWWLVAALLSLPVVASAARIAGVELQDQTQLGNCELSLNGAGLRRKVFFNVYGRGPLPHREEAVGGRGPRPRRAQAHQHHLDERHLGSPEEHEAVKSRVQEVADMLLVVQQGREGDVITLDWLPDSGTLVSVNGEVMGQAIPGKDVYCALLRVWLGDHPTSSDLKRALLGQMD